MRLMRAGVGLIVLAATVSVLLAADRFEQITVTSGAAIGFTTAKVNPVGGVQATVGTCRLETAEVRFAYDGTTPTSTVGTLLEPGEVLTVPGNGRLVKFLAIATTATSGQLDCNYTP